MHVKKIEEENNGDIEELFQNYYRKQQKNPEEYVTGQPVKINKTKVA